MVRKFMLASLALPYKVKELATNQAPSVTHNNQELKVVIIQYISLAYHLLPLGLCQKIYTYSIAIYNV